MTSQNYLNPQEIKMHRIKERKKDLKKKMTSYIEKLKTLKEQN